MTLSPTRAMGAPFKYVQGPGELKNLPTHLKPWGDKLLAIIDGFLFDNLSEALGGVCQKAGMGFVPARFGGECTQGEVARLAALADSEEVDVVAGLGGGKTLDTAKLVARDRHLPTIIIPTSASTDAPVSAMAVLYAEDGRHLRYEALSHAPELILVDSEIIAKAPLRLFVSGIGDAFSTWLEAEANRLSGTPNYIGKGYRPCLAAQAVARACWDAVRKSAVKAVDDLRDGIITEAVEDVIEANILLSGIGFENTGCAAAHALHTGLHELEGSGAIFHGEMVAFGSLFQLVLEEAPLPDLIEATSFLARLGLPVTFEDMGLKVGEAEFGKIASRIFDGASGIEAEPFKLTAEMVESALRKADRLGHDLRRETPELPAALCSPAARG